MRAWRFHEVGEPEDVLTLDKVARPHPGPHQVLVRVRAAAVNFADALVIRGGYQEQAALPAVPGMEVCGEVIAVGEGVDLPSTGHRVAGLPAAPHGGYAEYTVLAAADALPAPAQLDDAEAASLVIAYQTSWFALHRRAGLRAGETLLVHAAAGGVGSAAVQLGVAAGARVIGVVGDAEKAATARSLGCDVVVKRGDDVAAAVKAATGGRGADVVLDPVGGTAFAASTRCTAFEGRVVVVGFASGEARPARTDHLMVKNYTLMGLHWGLYRTVDPPAVQAAHEQICALVGRGLVRPSVSLRLDFGQVPAAIALVAGGSSTGRVVISLEKGDQRREAATGL